MTFPKVSKASSPVATEVRFWRENYSTSSSSWLLARRLVVVLFRDKRQTPQFFLNRKNAIIILQNGRLLLLRRPELVRVPPVGLQAVLGSLQAGPDRVLPRHGASAPAIRLPVAVHAVLPGAALQDAGDTWFSKKNKNEIGWFLFYFKGDFLCWFVSVAATFTDNASILFLKISPSLFHKFI